MYVCNVCKGFLQHASHRPMDLSSHVHLVIDLSFHMHCVVVALQFNCLACVSSGFDFFAQVSPLSRLVSLLPQQCLVIAMSLRRNHPGRGSLPPHRVVTAALQIIKMTKTQK